MDLTKNQYIDRLYNLFIQTHKQNGFPVDSTIREHYKLWSQDTYIKYGKTMKEPYDALIAVLSE